MSPAGRNGVSIGAMPEPRTCPECGRKMPPQAVRCIYCGKAPAVKCRKCGRITRDGSVVCAHCGADLLDDAPSPAKTKPVRPWAAAPAPAAAASRAEEASTVGWKTALVMVPSLLIILFVGQTFLTSARLGRKSQGVQKVHVLWDKAKDLARNGQNDAARDAYAEAIATMDFYSVKDATIRAVLERELADLSAPAKGAAPGPGAAGPSGPADAREALKKEGYVFQGTFAVFARPPSKTFYLQRLCVEAWVKAVNVGDKPAKIVRGAFKAHFDNGAVLAADEIYEPYLLPDKEIAPGESTSGALVFGAHCANTLKAEEVKEMTYVDKTIWRRRASPAKP